MLVDRNYSTMSLLELQGEAIRTHKAMGMLYWNNKERDKDKDKDKGKLPTPNSKPHTSRMVDSHNFNDLFHRLHIVDEAPGMHARSTTDFTYELHDYFVGLAD